MAWDAHQYEAFSRERERPFIDLLAAVPAFDPAKVVDAGCGTGRTTALLAERYPRAEVVGIDSSTEMLADAMPGHFELLNAAIEEWMPEQPVDLVISNAVLHWIPNPKDVLQHVASWVKDGGVLAIQVPANHDAPSHRIVRDVAASHGVAEVARGDHVLSLDAYRNQLESKFDVQAWDQTYDMMIHGAGAVLAWLKGTTLRPFLAALPANQHDAFLEALGNQLSAAYPSNGGTTCFPFRRRFIVARRRANGLAHPRFEGAARP